MTRPYKYRYDWEYYVWRLLLPIYCPSTGEVHWVSPGEVFTRQVHLHNNKYFHNSLDK